MPLKPKGYRVQVALPRGDPARGRGRRARRAACASARSRAKRARPAARAGRWRRSRSSAATRRSASDARAIAAPEDAAGRDLRGDDAGLASARRSLEEGGRLRNDRRAGRRVELDEILDSLDPFTRAAFRTWQQDLGALGRGPRARPQRLVRQPARRSSRPAATCSRCSTSSAPRCGGSCENTGVVFGALTEREDQLRVADHRRRTTCSPRSPRERRRSPRRLAGLPDLPRRVEGDRRRAWSRSRARPQPLVRDLQPALRDLGPTLDSVGDFAPRPAALLPRLRPADHDLEALAAGDGRDPRRAAADARRARAVPRRSSTRSSSTSACTVHAVGHVRQPRRGDGGEDDEPGRGPARPLPAPVRPARARRRVAIHPNARGRPTAATPT